MNKKIIFIGILFLMMLFTNTAMASISFSDESPSDTSILWDMSTSQTSVTINASDGSTFNWTIDTSPDIGNSSANGESNGSKTCSISDYNYSTTYTWYINSTDGSTWHNASYTFTTRDAQLHENPALGSVEKTLVGVVGIFIIIGLIYVTIKSMEGQIDIAKFFIFLIIAIVFLGIIMSAL